MGFKFNPFTGNFDQTGSGGGGGGSSYIDGEVATYNDLPLDGTAPLNSAWLVREASGTWLLGRKPAGIYIRTATAGVSRDADYTYAGILPDVFSDGNFTLYDESDSTKNAKFQLSGIATGTTRTITVPNKNITLDDAGDSRTPTAHAAAHAAAGSDPLFDQDLNTTSFPTFGDLSVTGSFDASNFVTSGVVNLQSGALFVDSGATAVEFGVPIIFANGAEADSRTNLGLEIGTDVAAASHTHELTALAATGATNGHVLTANGSNGATFAALPASGVTGAAASASDVLGVSGSNITGVDANADRIIFFDDSAGKLTHLTVGSGLSISDTTITATASGGSKTYAVFTAEHNQPPSTAFATLDTRNSIAVLDFDDATDESAVFVSIIPEGASLGSGLKIRLHWMATTATSGNVVWDVSLERMTTDLDSDSFDTIASGTAAANGTSGILTVTEITLTTIDSVTAGDGFRLKVTRDANNASDTMTGDAELVVCEVRSAA